MRTPWKYPIAAAVASLALVVTACFPPPAPTTTTVPATTTTTAPPLVPYRTPPTVDGLPAESGAAGVPSADGRYVAFHSDAMNYGPAIAPFQLRVFLWDTQTDTVVRQPDGYDGQEPNQTGNVGAVSADGTRVLFSSWASNLVPGDTNDTIDVFVWDTQTGTVTRQPDGHDGNEPNSFSNGSAMTPDGRYALLSSEATNLVPGATDIFSDVYVWDTQTDTLTRQPDGYDGQEPNFHSTAESISDDGRWVAFRSEASNLVPGDTNGIDDIFVWDTQTDTLTRQPDGHDGEDLDDFASTVEMSGDGRYITFSSGATNLVPGDTNDSTDIFVWDTQTDTVTRQPDGYDGNEPVANSIWPSISGDGRYVAFTSFADNLVPDDANAMADAFVWDTQTDTVTRQPDGYDGNEPDALTFAGAISANGRFVTLASSASNLIDTDTGPSTLYLWDRDA